MQLTDTKIPGRNLKYVNGTLEEWVRESDAELAAIEAEIRGMRELLDDDNNN